MSRYQRSVEIEDLVVTLAESRQGITIGDIAERYEVSRRTAERMRDAVAERFPLVEAGRCEGDRRKRWRIDGRAGHVLGSLAAADRATMMRAAQSLREAGRAELARELEDVARRLGREH